MRNAILNFAGTAGVNSITTDWVVGNTSSFIINEALGGKGRFNFQGFKNIDVYGIKIVGKMLYLGVNNKGLIQDFTLVTKIEGNSPLIGGSPQQSPTSIDQPSTPTFNLTKYIPSVDLCEPIKSVEFIEVIALEAQGINFQITLAPDNYSYNFDIIVYYKFEGE
jgi:hypothetical protein